MGVGQSKAESIVESIVNSGISVVKTTMNKTTTPITNINEIDLTGCDGIVISDVTMKNFATVDVSSVVTALSDTELQQQIAKAMQAQAESEVIGGLGWQQSQVDSITKSITNLSTAVNESVSNMAEASTTQINRITCGGAKNAIVRKVDMENTTKLLLNMVTESESVTMAKAALEEDLAAQGVSKTKGFDPTMIIFLIVAIIAFFLFGGLGLIAKTLLSTSFWMIACGAATGFFIYMIVSSWTGTWPGAKPPTDWPMTTDEEIAAKRAEEVRVKSRNASVRKWGAILAAVGGVATAGFGYAFSKQGKPKTIRQTVITAPTK